MQNLEHIQPVDYLIIGHITQDVTSQGLVLGGTASYASLTAKAFGLRVGIVTSCADNFLPDELKGIIIHNKSSTFTSTFENIYTVEGRIQHIHHVAEKITLGDVPELWRSTPIVHFGPLANELEPNIVHGFPQSMIGLTPQGWMRGWDDSGIVTYKDWEDAEIVLPFVEAAVMSIEDIRGNEDIVAEYAGLSRVLAVTEGAAGSRVYWNGDVRYFRPPLEQEVDPVGAGDIFATSFFIRYSSTRDPWESARFATLVAANSVTRKAIKGVPTPEEASRFMTEIIEHSIL